MFKKLQKILNNKAIGGETVEFFITVGVLFVLVAVPLGFILAPHADEIGENAHNSVSSSLKEFHKSHSNEFPTQLEKSMGLKFIQLDYLDGDWDWAVNISVADVNSGAMYYYTYNHHKGLGIYGTGPVYTSTDYVPQMDANSKQKYLSPEQLKILRKEHNLV